MESSLAWATAALAGSILYPVMGAPLSRHYAVAATDTGHEGAANDASFALGHGEKVIDYAYRAVHEMTVRSKLILEAYYGRPAKFSDLERLFVRRDPGILRSGALSGGL